ncbi:MAG: glycosyltransferase family 39 protein [Bacteroidales bacterium]|nr:glycosyltransferase family 39 protein [Bacteroidales bacterium]
MKQVINYLFIALLGGLFFIPFLGGVHLFDWDEVNFAEISREMIASEDYLRVQVNYEPFYEKPPLFFWLQVISMKIFGINEFAARFPNALVGILTLILLFRIGKKLYNTRFGMIWSLAYFGSILPNLYFKSGIIDPLFNLLIFMGLYNFIRHVWGKRRYKSNLFLKHSSFTYLVDAGILIGLAILTKGPVAFLVVFLVMVVYWVVNKFRFFTNPINIVFLGFIAFFVTFLWFGMEMLKNGPEFMTKFIRYQFRLFSTPDAGHGGIPGYHVFVLLLGCFPASIFAIRGFFKMKQEQVHLVDLRKWMIYLFWVVLILFSIVQSKIVHYSSLAYFPITFLAALTIDQILKRKIDFAKWMKWGIISIALLFVMVSISAPIIGSNINRVKPLFQNNPDILAALEAKVNWTGWEFITGLVMVLIVVAFFVLIRRDKMYWAFRILFIGVAIFVFTGLTLFVGRIEKITQNAHVEFARSLVGKEGYIVTSGFKSYIHLFYSKRQPPVYPNHNELKHLIWEDFETDVYIVARKHNEDYWKNVNTVEQIGEKNGFVFFKRKR